jgi:hypothetical protein
LTLQPDFDSVKRVAHHCHSNATHSASKDILCQLHHPRAAAWLRYWRRLLNLRLLLLVHSCCVCHAAAVCCSCYHNLLMLQEQWGTKIRLWLRLQHQQPRAALLGSQHK